MTQTAFSEEGIQTIREIVRDEIAISGLPTGLDTLVRALMMIVRWAQKTKERMEREGK